MLGVRDSILFQAMGRVGQRQHASLKKSEWTGIPGARLGRYARDRAAVRIAERKRMVEKAYDWAQGVPLEEHTTRKHKILREYFARYLTVRCAFPAQSKFR